MSDKPDGASDDAWNRAQSVAIDFINWADQRSADSSLDPDAEHVLAKIIAKIVMAAKAEEREACAKVAEQKVHIDGVGFVGASPRIIAKAIRSRT